MIDPPDREVAVFSAARHLPVGERAAYLAKACAGDPALRRRVEELLKAGEEAGAFLDQPAIGAQPADDLVGSPDPNRTVRIPGTPAEKAGDRIGRYKLLQQIGEGGCGVVYLAEQEEPVRRQVALKVIKLGMDTKSVIARFEAERQALALMDHPNIAKVLDAGATETGRPYFVMELVRGIRITDYCDRNNLPTRERLNLFVQVCQAIQHAHQKGIIHRDIKPSNILVTLRDGVPVPKVIDFGIAKATTDQRLTDKTLFTAFEQFIGTPAYMSPEQAEMSELGIDTRSDIYSLGVLLYELLTGQTPFEAKDLLQAGLNAMRRIIREQEPARPSTRLSTLLAGELTIVAGHRQTEPSKLVHLLRGDLDWIVIKSLEKDRARRYETANGLAADIQRHLNNEPVSARPPSKLYRFQKSVQRNLLAFVAAGAVAGALVIGLAVATWQFVEKSRAEVEANRLRLQAETRETEERDLLYVYQMSLAQHAWDQNDFTLLDQLLEETQEFPGRGFEWYYWQRQAHFSLLTLHGGQKGYLARAAFSPDGRWIAIVSGNSANLWDATSGQELLTFKGHSNAIWSVAFSPDGQRLVTGSSDRTAKIWDVASGRELLSLKGHRDRVWAVAFSPNGKKIITSSLDQTAKIWDAASGRELLMLKGNSNIILSVAFSPDNRRIVTGSADHTAKLWDATSGQELLAFKGHSNAIWSVAFSPDGQRLVTGSSDQTAKIWDVASGRELLSLKGHNGIVSSVAFSPDSQRIVTGSFDQTAKVWDAGSGRFLFTIKGHKDSIWSVAFSPDGQRILTGSSDQTAKVWDAAYEQEPLTIKGVGGAMTTVVFSPDGKRIVTGGQEKTKVWDAVSGQELLTLYGHNDKIRSIAFSPDGQRIVTVDSGAVKVWDAASGSKLRSFYTNVLCVAFSPDGQRIVTGDSGSIKIWDATSARELLGFGGSVDCVAFSPDGQRIVTGGQNNQAKVWDVASGREVLTLNSPNAEVAGYWIVSVAFSRNGQRIITGSMDKTARVWNAISGQELLTFKGHKDEVRSVAFSPDGQRVVTGSADGTAKLWETESGREFLTLNGHNDQVLSVAFSPDGQNIATSSSDGTAKVWGTARPEQVAVWRREEEAQAPDASEQRR